MLYNVQPGDTLWNIARRFDTTVSAILDANVICNPNLIFPGQSLIIPRPNLDLPTAGAGPYYVVLPGDSLYCLAQELGTTVSILAEINSLANPDLIYAGSELLLIPDTVPDPAALKAEWEHTGGVPCEEIPEFTIYGVYYLGTFRWAALGRTAIPYLLDLLSNPCYIVRLYALETLGRIGRNSQVSGALAPLLNDPNPSVAKQAAFTLRRITLVQNYGKRIHLLTTNNELIKNLNTGSPVVPLPEGTEITVLRWHLPSPTGEEGPRGGIQIYDQIQVFNTGEIGYLPRFGLEQLTFI